MMALDIVRQNTNPLLSRNFSDRANKLRLDAVSKWFCIGPFLVGHCDSMELHWAPAEDLLR